MKTFATAQVQGAYKAEEVRIYSNSDNVPRFVAPGWRPMSFPKGDFAAACRKVSMHPQFVAFI